MDERAEAALLLGYKCVCRSPKKIEHIVCQCHRIHPYRNRIPFTFLFNSHKIQNHAASLSHCDLNWNSINYPAEISTRARTRQKPTYIRTKNMNVIRAIICYFHKMRVIYYNQKKKEIEIILIRET